MSVRAVESLTKSVRMHRNPKYFGANAPLFLPHQILVGGPVVYVQGLFPKTTRALLSMFSNSPTVISVTVFCLGQLFDHNTLIRLYCPTRFIRWDMMRKLIYVLFIFIPFCTHARTLHIGDNAIKLSEFKTTAPALHVRIGDELWYGNMCTNFNTDSLHIKYNDTVYDVIDPFVDTTNYTYDTDGRLIGANKNIYLESTGTQWVDTGFISKAGTAHEVLLKVENIITPSTQCYGGNACRAENGVKSHFAAFSFAQNSWVYYFNDFHITSLRVNVGDLFLAKLSVSADNTYAIAYGYNITTGKSLEVKQYGIIIPTGTTFLFAGHRCNYINEPFENSYGRIYHFKIWDNDTLVRHFVPVPCGLQIGDFVVPSNGMWDIVEQKFYGNMGTGDFIYGVDK